MSAAILLMILALICIVLIFCGIQLVKRDKIAYAAVCFYLANIYSFAVAAGNVAAAIAIIEFFLVLAVISAFIFAAVFFISAKREVRASQSIAY